MTYDINENCTCGEALTVCGTFQGQPITHCPHCDLPLSVQPAHDPNCLRCERYRRHALRIFPDGQQ